MTAHDILRAATDKVLEIVNMIPSPSPTPSVYLSTPPPLTYKTWPNEPQVLLPPAPDHRSLSHPFNIDPSLYNNALHISVPITIAVAYATTVYFINQQNSKRDHKPWAFSRTLWFFAFVVSHNIGLALYSAWTFTGMLNAIRHSWPGLKSRQDLPQVVDTLCKMHGPRGYGSAATWNPSNHSWGLTDNVTQLLAGQPDSSDVGRLWNEGLAYYGWIFYISKFYEILDSLIVLAKGKRTGFLQTYHHAGAMMAMWAGIRYMSPPIWMFTFINSGLHTLMYTYYAAAALNIRVPAWMKRTLTSLQIIQIVFGSSYAFAHLWVAYDMPMQIPYIFSHGLSHAMSSASSVFPSATSSVASAVSSATATAGIGNILKKVALRAGGHEGLAENVRNNQGEVFGVDAVRSSQVEKAQEEVRYKMEYQRVNCLDTSGEVAAILFNLTYLLPLTWLFVNFFIKSYSKRRNEPPPPTKYDNTKASGKDATKSLEDKIKDTMDVENTGRQVDRPEDLRKQLDDFKAKTEDIAGQAQHGVKDFVEKTKEKAMEAAQKAKEIEEEIVQKAMSASRESTGGFEKVEHEDAEPEREATPKQGSGDDPNNSAKQPSEDQPSKEDSSNEQPGVKQKEFTQIEAPKSNDSLPPGSTSEESKEDSTEPPKDSAHKENSHPNEPQTDKDKDTEAMPPPSTNGAPKKSSSRPPSASRSSSIPAPTPQKGKTSKSRSTSRKPASKPGTPATEGGKQTNGDVPPIKDEEGSGKGGDAAVEDNDGDKKDEDTSPATDGQDGMNNNNGEKDAEEKNGEEKEEEAKELEVNPDEMLDGKEKNAQGEMQP